MAVTFIFVLVTVVLLIQALLLVHLCPEFISGEETVWIRYVMMKNPNNVIIISILVIS